MADLPTSITARVKIVEDCLADIRTRLRELETLKNHDTLVTVLNEVTIELQGIRCTVDDIRSLVRYK